MKNIIATALILTAGVAQAESFQHERAIGAEQLFPTLITEQATSVDTGRNANFAYQEAIGSSDLFPLADAEDVKNTHPTGRTVFEFQVNVGSEELDPSLS
jgi:hypothetical protein